jgi:hypothetical protein
MDDSPDEAVPAAGAAAASPPDANRLDIRARGADATLGRISFQKPEAISVRRLPPLFECLFSYGPHAALAACLFGFVWVAASYFSGGQLPFYVMKPGLVQTVVPQESVELAEMLRTAQKMAEDIRVLKARQCTPRTARSPNLRVRSSTCSAIPRRSFPILSSGSIAWNTRSRQSLPHHMALTRY